MIDEGTNVSTFVTVGPCVQLDMRDADSSGTVYSAFTHRHSLSLHRSNTDRGVWSNEGASTLARRVA